MPCDDRWAGQNAQRFQNPVVLRIAEQGHGGESRLRHGLLSTRRCRLPGDPVQKSSRAASTLQAAGTRGQAPADAAFWRGGCALDTSRMRLIGSENPACSIAASSFAQSASMVDHPTNPPSDRSGQILRALVAQYIREGQPIGSRTLARASGLNLSPATIRNVMADLEEYGFVAAPHTSAGRVPTAKGYRFFVDTLVKLQPLAAAEVARLQGQLVEDATGDAKTVAEAASAALSSLTHMAGVVTLPRQKQVTLRQVEFLPLVQSARAGDIRGQRSRGAESRARGRSRVLGRRAAPSGQFPQRALHRTGHQAGPGAYSRGTAGDAGVDEPSDDRRHFRRRTRIRPGGRQTGVRRQRRDPT